MGEAKRKVEELKQALLREADLWSFPPSDAEREAVATILALPRVTVVRAPAEQLAWARMKPRQCHANARWYADNDPEKQWKHVAGWWPQGDILVLHSVICNGADYGCVTPQEWDVPQRFSFIPDHAIEWREDGVTRGAYRGGLRVEAGLRIDPLAQIAAAALMRDRLNAGMSPRRVMELADQEANERLQAEGH